MKRRIAVLAGDGIGPQVMQQAIRVLDVIAQQFGHTFDYLEGLIGGAAYDVYHEHFPGSTRRICEASDAILFGSVGGPVAELKSEKWKGCEVNSLLGLRKAFGFGTNLRPIRVRPELAALCPLRPELVAAGIDLLIVRELNGDLYFGEKKTYQRSGLRVAEDLAEYTEEQIASVTHHAFRVARSRRKKVTSVDKANVLETSKLWREIVHEIARDWPDVVLEDMLVDNCAMQLIRNPAQFDVILTSNLFGDILSDAAAALAGSLGLLPSASLNSDGFGLYEPPGGSAQDIAGQEIANPLAQILSAALMLKCSFGLARESEAIESAVTEALRHGARTADIALPGEPVLSTAQMTERVLAYLQQK